MDSTMLLAIAIGATVACVFACVAALAGRVFRQSKEPGKEAEGLSAVGEPIAIAPLQHWTVPKSVECRICGKSVPSSQQVHPECDDVLANAKSDIEIVFVGFAV